MSLNGSTAANAARTAPASQAAVKRSAGEAGAVAMFSIARTSNAIPGQLRAQPGRNFVGAGLAGERKRLGVLRARAADVVRCRTLGFTAAIPGQLVLHDRRT